MPARFDFSPSGMNAVGKDVSRKLLTTTAMRVHADATQRAPVDTGALRQSHRIMPITSTSKGMRVEVRAEQSYAMAVHEGTSPRVIKPRRARVLSWGSGAGRVFARAVRHPGSKPRPWLRNALQVQAQAAGFIVTDR